MKLLDRKITDKISDMVSDIVATCSRILSTEAKVAETNSYDSKEDAKNRLKLVLMHDRSQLTPGQMEQMKEELIDVISRYVEIDRDALDLCLEAETNTIALVANIPVLRTRNEQEKLQNQIDAAMTEGQSQEASSSAEPQTEECQYVCEVVGETIQCGCENEPQESEASCDCSSSCDCGCQKTE